MKKVTFKQVLVSVLSVLSVGCMATATSLWNNGNSTVLAESLTVDTKSLVSVKDATVTESVSVGGKDTLKISSATAYSGEFNGTFHGNMDLKYRFPNQYTNGSAGGNLLGDFTFTIADARPDYAKDNQFSVKIEKRNTYLQTYVYYTGATIGTVSNAPYFGTNRGKPTNAITNGSSKYFGGTYGQFNDNSSKYNSLNLTWDAEGVLTVGYFYNATTSTTLVQFNGLAYSTTAGAYGWGLPKIAFPEGYTVSFSSDYTAGVDTNGDSTVDDYGTDVCFISLNESKETNSLGGDTLSVVSSKTSVLYDGVIKEANDVIEIDQYTSKLENFTYGSVNTLLPYETIKAGEESSDDPTYETIGYFEQASAMQTATLAGETVDLTKAGDYAITAQGTPLTIRVLPVVNATSLVSTNADKSVAAITSASETKGLLISSKEAYAGDVNATFGANAAFDLRYRFPNQYGADSGIATTAGGDLKGNFVFTFADASDPKNVEKQFVVEISSKGSTRVGYNGTYATTWTRSGLPSKYVDYGGYAFGSAPKYNNADETAVTNSIILEWEGDILTVYACNSIKTQDKVMVAQFNGIAFDSTAQYAYGLPKMNFPNGYVVSFESNYAAGLDTDGDGTADDYGTDVNLVSLNGFAFGQNNYKVTVGETSAYVDGQKVTALGKGVTTVDLTTVATYADDNANTLTTALTTKNVAVGEVVDGKATVSHNPLNQKIAPSVELIAGVDTYTVTYMVDGEAQTATVAENTAITLESATLANKTFVGWKIGDGLYAEGDEYTVTGDVTITAIGVSFGIFEGASVRMSTTENGKGGLRFMGYILTEDMAENVTFGMYLNGTKVAAEKQLTATSASALAKEKYNADNTYFTVVITDLAVENYATDVTAFTYISVTYADGDSKEFKTTASVTRNAKQVAEAAKAKGETGEMLDKYINGEA